MHSDLQSAREFANHIRFSGDSLRCNAEGTSETSSLLKSIFYCNELCISKQVTPELHSSLVTVLNRLGINQNSIEAFVYASSEINAQCYSGQNNECVIRFSSALIDLLNKNEFEFVIGHELGHFLLSHTDDGTDINGRNVELYIQQRAQEISADRLGLVSCDSLDVAIKALIKTVSGLNDQHLRFDVGSFLSQLKKTDGSAGMSHQSTHPSILVRCRALMWFSLNTSYMNNSKNYNNVEMIRLDESIKRDLNKYVDASFRHEIENAKNNLSIWTSAFEIIQDNNFNKEEQKLFEKLYGVETLDKLIRFLSGLPSNEIHDAVFKKLDEARQDLEVLMPYSFESEIKTLKKWKL